MRCLGFLCLQLLGEGDSETAQRIGDYIEKNDMQYLQWKGGKGAGPFVFPLYFWYYGTRVMFQREGQGWKTRNSRFQKILVKEQHKEGYLKRPLPF